MEKKDIPQVKALVDTYIGQDFYSIDFLQEIINKNKHYVLIAEDTSAKSDEDLLKIVGMFFAFTDTIENALSRIGVDESYIIGLDIAPMTNTLVLKTAILMDEYQGHGIMKNLMHSAAEKAQQDDYHIILSLLLKYKKTGSVDEYVVPAEHRVIELGLKKIKELPHPWIDKDFYCPYCKSRKCTCDGLFYLKKC